MVGSLEYGEERDYGWMGDDLDRLVFARLIASTTGAGNSVEARENYKCKVCSDPCWREPYCSISNHRPDAQTLDLLQGQNSSTLLIQNREKHVFFEKNGRTSAFHYGRVTVNKTKRNLQTANAVHSTAMEVQQSSSTTKQTEKDKRR
jgi:hypothetical protein